MLTASIPAYNIQAMQQAILTLPSWVDAIEWRMDYWDQETIALEPIKSLLQSTTMHSIITLRDKSQGGHYPFDENQRMDQLLKLAELKPFAIDVESHLPDSFIDRLKSIY